MENIIQVLMGNTLFQSIDGKSEQGICNCLIWRSVQMEDTGTIFLVIEGHMKGISEIKSREGRSNALWPQ